MALYIFFQNLLSVFVKIANKISQKKSICPAYQSVSLLVSLVFLLGNGSIYIFLLKGLHAPMELFFLFRNHIKRQAGDYPNSSKNELINIVIEYNALNVN
jgi:hypothetical protein